MSLSDEQIMRLKHKYLGIAQCEDFERSDTRHLAFARVVAEAAIAADRAARGCSECAYAEAMALDKTPVCPVVCKAAPPAVPVVPKGLDEALRALAKVHGWKFVWGHAKALAEGTNRCHKCHGDGLTHSSRCFHYNADGERASMLAAAPALSQDNGGAA